MSNFELNKEQGPHAASGMTDEDLQYLLRIVSLELAVRMEADQYGKSFHEIAEAREDMDEMIFHLRRDRDRISFVAAITADLERLSLTTDREVDEAHGMHL